MRFVVTLTAVFLLLGVSAFGQVDSVIVGSVDVDSGYSSAIIPLWVTTVDSAETIFWSLCLHSPDDNDARFAGIEYFYPLTMWAMRFDSIMPDGRVMQITAYAQSDPGPGPYPLFTDNQRWNIITLRIGLDPAMSPRQIVIDSLRAIHLGRNGTVFVAGIINYGIPVTSDNITYPDKPTLSQNYPNPFNAQTQIRFTLSQAGPVRLTIYNLLGQQVAVLVDGRIETGEHTVMWDAGDAPSGVYFGKLAGNGFDESMRMTLLR